MTSELYAFWRYDLYPYVLGGEITKIKDDGRVETVGYGPGTTFKPFLILPLLPGRKLMMSIKELTREHDDAFQSFNKEWKLKLAKLIRIPED